MGGTTVQGLVRGHFFENEDITVSDPNVQVLEKYKAMGVHTTTNNVEAAEQADIVCVVVKPWLVETVLRGIKPVLAPQRQLLIVVAAGITSQSVEEWLGLNCPPLFLVIPNIAIAQMQSMTFIVPVGASKRDTQTILDIYNEMGGTLITVEEHLPAGTTLASCGIAYAMRYIRAASEGGVELGFKADDAKKIVLQTLRGAIELLEETGLHPEAAIDLVTTPQGVTIKGLNEMERAGFTSAVIRGLRAGLK